MMKKFLFLIVTLLFIGCSIKEQESIITRSDQDIEIDTNYIEVDMNYIIYYDKVSIQAESGFILKLHNSKNYDIYIPYIRGLRTLLVEQQKGDRYETLDATLLWPAFKRYGPFFAQNIYTDTLSVKVILDSMIKQYPDVNWVDMERFIEGSCFIKKNEDLVILIPASVFPKGDFRISIVEYLSNNCYPDEAFKHNPPLEIAGYKLFKGKLKAEPLKFRIETKNKFEEIQDYY